MGDISRHKKELRHEMHSARDQLSSRYRQKASLGIITLGFDVIHDFAKGQGIVSFYMPIRNEMDPQPLARALEKKNIPLCLPRIITGQKVLDFKTYHFGDALLEGHYGVMEPLSDSQSVVPHIVILPLLAADPQGNRLGYGGGYYDETIRSLRQAGEVKAIGICFEAQIVEAVPHDDHDMRLEWLITEEKVRAF